jgi:hypothetical protein
LGSQHVDVDHEAGAELKWSLVIGQWLIAYSIPPRALVSAKADQRAGPFRD